MKEIKILDKLNIKKLISLLPENTIALNLVGSDLYGLEESDSDIDLIAFTKPSREDLVCLSLGKPFDRKTIEISKDKAIEYGVEKEITITIYSVVDFFKSIEKTSTTTLEYIKYPLYSTTEFEKLKDAIYEIYTKAKNRLKKNIFFYGHVNLRNFYFNQPTGSKAKYFKDGKDYKSLSKTYLVYLQFKKGFEDFTKLYSIGYYTEEERKIYLEIKHGYITEELMKELELFFSKDSYEYYSYIELEDLTEYKYYLAKLI